MSICGAHFATDLLPWFHLLRYMSITLHYIKVIYSGLSKHC